MKIEGENQKNREEKEDQERKTAKISDSNVYYKARSVSKKFRDAAEARYPNAFRTKEYQVFLYWILFRDTRMHTKEEARPLYCLYLQKMIGKPNNFSTGEFLKKFEEDTGIPLNISPYEFKTRSRVVEPEIDPLILDLVKEEMSTPAKEKLDRVFFIGGNSWTPRKHTEFVEAEYKFHYKRSSGVILKYFAEIIKPRHYKKYTNNLEAVWRDVEASTELTTAEKTRTKNILTQLSESLAPQYREKSAYHRVFAEGHSLQFLKSEYRKKIFKGCLEIDIVSSQLALSGYLWGIQEVIELVESGVRVWDVLHNQMSIVETPATKAKLKDGLYAVLYGGGENAIREALEDYPSEFQNKFMDLPFIINIRDHSKIQQEIILKNKGIMSAQGIRIPKIGSPAKAQALHLQSYERLLIEEVYKLAFNYKRDLRILSHEHDGMTIEILRDDNGRRTNTIQRIQKAVEEKGRELGMKIRIEVK